MLARLLTDGRELLEDIHTYIYLSFYFQSSFNFFEAKFLWAYWMMSQNHWRISTRRFFYHLISLSSIVCAMCSRVQWEIFFFHFNSWHTFFSVFFNSKTGLFSCIFLFEDSFICQFTYLHLLSGLQGKIRQNIYDSPNKYFKW